MLPLALLMIALAPPPPTPRHPVTDEYHGIKVADDYRWLENWEEPAVRAWTDAQNARARAYLDALPGRQKIHDRLETLIRSSSVSYGGLTFRGGLLFAEIFDPKKQQPAVVTLKSAYDPASERTIVDPNALDPTGHTAIDFWVPSLDGKTLAASLSKNGSETGDLHLYEAATGKEFCEVIPQVNKGTAGGSMAFTPDGSGFWYTRYPRPGELPPEDADFFQQIYFHRIGTSPDRDQYELGKDFPRIAEIELATKRDGKWVLADVKNGDGGEVAFFVRPTAPAGKWTRVCGFKDQAWQAAFGPDQTLYLLSRKNAPKSKVLRLSLTTPTIDRATELVPEREGAVESITTTQSKLYLREILGGPSQVEVFDLATGHPEGKLPIPPVSSVHGITRLEDDAVLFESGSYVNPPAWFHYEPGAGAKPTALRETSPVAFSDVEVVRDFAVSQDGTKVPLNILMKKGTKLDGSNPTLLTAYGGYGVSQTPSFGPARRIWFDAGGVIVIANLRGGGEYGDAWHQAGNLLDKQHVFDDFYAAARYLIDHRYTNPRRLAIEGGSNGGLLMGATLTQHPATYRAVVSHVGIYDMLRVENTPNGSFNVTEFGSVKNPDQFKALYAYSPYHHVVDGTKYPSVLLITGQNDPRVDPWHSRKFAARLQAATSSDNPILLSSSADWGHGVGSSIEHRIATATDSFAFLFHELGVPVEGER